MGGTSPLDGCTVDDFFTLDDLPPHTQLIDGNLVFASPQRRFHSLAVDLLEEGLRRRAPAGLRVRRQMSVVLDRQNVPEPDLTAVMAEADGDLRQDRYRAADVLLAVEVLSPESEARDQDTKPRKYAAAGIRHFWLVAMDEADDRPVVHVYELDTVTGAYVCSGIHRDKLQLTAPYEIDIDLTEIDRL